MAPANALRWDGSEGHYEVYYLTLTDPASGTGLWIRYTMLAPLRATGNEPTCSLWFLAMDPVDPDRHVARKGTWPISELVAHAEPFELRIAGATLTDSGMRGEFEDVAWDLRWSPTASPYRHVHPLLERARIAKTVLLLPHGDLSISGTVRMGDRTLNIEGARGGQAHLWGSQHAARWAWAHCNDFQSTEGAPQPGDFVDGVSVYVPRFGREVGPNTPVVGRIAGRDFASISPARVLRNRSTFSLTTWSWEATDGARKLSGEVDVRREQLVGVTYHDPDGTPAWCYNSEVASMRLHVYDRDRSHPGGWRLTHTLTAPGRAHFEYAQRAPVPDLPVHLT
jgi:hypothetical protein